MVVWLSANHGSWLFLHHTRSVNYLEHQEHTTKPEQGTSQSAVASKGQSLLCGCCFGHYIALIVSSLIISTTTTTTTITPSNVTFLSFSFCMFLA